MKIRISAVREVLNNNFTFADLSPRFKNVDSSTGNIYCPFHENHDTPAAKMYWNEEKQIWTLHCFGECHRSYTAYDYVDLILCYKYEKYRDPLHFLYSNMEKNLLEHQLKISNAKVEVLLDTLMKRKIDYINNLANDYDSTEEYIERLYLG